MALTAFKINNLDAKVRNLRKEGPVVLLESQFNSHHAGNKSYLAGRPSKILKASDGVLMIKDENSRTELRGNIWQLLREQFSENPDWYFGYLGYDLKNDIEDLTSNNPDPVGGPDMFFIIPDFLLEIDHQKNCCKQLRGKKNSPLEAGGECTSFELENLIFSTSKNAYKKKIDKILELIREGDLYEMNLAHQSSSRFQGDPYSVYTRMRQEGPVPFGAYLHTGELDICCSSPERFLAKRGQRLISQPMKGTIKRGKTEEEDAFLKKRLAASKKEQAENLMIVDLVRHDMNKITVPGTVEAANLFEIQAFPTVYQMISTVEGVAACENPVDIIKACFPMGSMTGAPKIRAMQRIEELETFKRGIYSGAIGYITPENDFDFNVVIRTAIIKQNRLFYAAGGAITGDSDAEEEWRETLLKKKALTNII